MGLVVGACAGAAPARPPERGATASDVPSPIATAPATPTPTPTPTPTQSPSPIPTPSPTQTPGASTPTPAPVSLPGPCLDPLAHFHAYYQTKFHVPFEPLETIDQVDLDGDGDDDLILLGGATDITQDAFYYVRRGDCAHAVGFLQSDGPGVEPLDTRSHGLFDLRGTRACRVHCCATQTEYTFRFDGKRYRLASSRAVPHDCSPPPGGSFKP